MFTQSSHSLSWGLHPWCQATQEGSYTHRHWALECWSWPFTSKGGQCPRHCPILVWVNPRPTPEVLVLPLGTPLKDWVSNMMTHYSFSCWSCSASSTSNLIGYCVLLHIHEETAHMVQLLSVLLYYTGRISIVGANPELGPISSVLKHLHC